MTVAALYVETGGVYYGLPDVDPWDEQRDARLYDGPWPVVAHPPCARWSRLASIHRKRWPIGADGGCFAAALKSVRTFGGVLWYLYENADEQDSERELAEAVLVLLGSASPSKPASLKSPLRVAGEPVDRQTPPL